MVISQMVENIKNRLAGIIDVTSRDSTKYIRLDNDVIISYIVSAVRRVCVETDFLIQTITDAGWIQYNTMYGKVFFYYELPVNWRKILSIVIDDEEYKLTDLHLFMLYPHKRATKTVLMINGVARDVILIGKYPEKGSVITLSMMPNQQSLLNSEILIDDNYAPVIEDIVVYEILKVMVLGINERPTDPQQNSGTNSNVYAMLQLLQKEIKEGIGMIRADVQERVGCVVRREVFDDEI